MQQQNKTLPAVDLTTGVHTFWANDWPTQLSTHGQWWSNLATHRLQKEQCLERIGLWMTHVWQNWVKSIVWRSDRSSTTCKSLSLTLSITVSDAVNHCLWRCQSLSMTLSIIVCDAVNHCQWRCQSLSVRLSIIVNDAVNSCQCCCSSWLCDRDP